MFGREHYVPVLRWKRGEQKALAALEGSDKDALTPIIEIPPDDFLPGVLETPINISTRFPRMTAALELAVGSRRVLLDFGLIDHTVVTADGAPPIQEFFGLLNGGGVTAIPVTGLRRTEAFQAAVRAVSKANGELALRLTRSDLARVTLEDDILAFLASNRLPFERVHLIVDIGLIGESGVKFLYVCARVPEISRWLTCTIVAGSFPKDLSHLPVGTHFLPRFEWLQWRASLKNVKLPRVPTFGDYTTQHARYQIPPPGANVSASVRYTTDESWLVMRGEGLHSEGGPGYGQYPATAELLCEQKEYSGPVFSYGDHYIWQIASRQIERTGSPETWLRAGVNHHLAFVVRQLAGLAASPLAP